MSEGWIKVRSVTYPIPYLEIGRTRLPHYRPNKICGFIWVPRWVETLMKIYHNAEMIMSFKEYADVMMDNNADNHNTNSNNEMGAD